MNETWHSIPRWPDYEVSSLGRVRCLARTTDRGRYFKERILKSRKHRHYDRVSLSQGDRKWSPLVQTLMRHVRA